MFPRARSSARVEFVANLTPDEVRFFDKAYRNQDWRTGLVHAKAGAFTRAMEQARAATGLPPAQLRKGPGSKSRRKYVALTQGVMLSFDRFPTIAKAAKYLLGKGYRADAIRESGERGNFWHAPQFPPNPRLQKRVQVLSKDVELVLELHPRT